MELQRRHLQNHPVAVARAVRRLMGQASGTDPQSPQDALGYYTRYGTFQNNRDAALIAWLMGSLWNLMEVGAHDEAHALLGLGLAAVEQWGLSGRLDLGYLWTHLPEPPWGVLQRPPQQISLRPYSRLAEPSWVAAMVAYLKDLEAMEDRLGGRGQRFHPGGHREKHPPPEDPGKRPPRGPRGRGKGGKEPPPALP